jgi:hypothetical protein
MKLARRLTMLLGLVLSSCPAFSQEPNVTLHSTVSGNQEQPKVMYILPWQQPGDARFEQGFNAQLSGDLFQPLDRQEFVRQLNYQALMSDADNTTDYNKTKF